MAIGTATRIARGDDVGAGSATGSSSGSAGAGSGSAGSLTLEQAVQLALTRNERAAISDLNVVGADAAVAKAKVAFLPVLVAAGSDTVHPIDHPVDTGAATLTLTQPLIAASAFPLYDQAKHALVAQKEQTVDDKRQLAFDAVRAYLAVLLAQKVVDAGERKLQTATQDVAATDAQSKAQLVSSNDVTRAEITRASTVRDLASDRGSLAAAYVQLAFTNNSPDSSRHVEPTARLAAGNAPVTAVDALVTQSLSRIAPISPRARTPALAAHDFAREPHMRFYPTLSLVGQMAATSAPPSGGHTVDGTIALTAGWSIWDAGNRDADERAREAAAAIADLTTDTLVRTIDQQVRTAAAQLTAAQESLIGAQDARDASRKSATETATLYDQGLAKAIELVDANEQRFEAEVAYAEAEYAVANAYVSLRQAMGEGPFPEATR